MIALPTRLRTRLLLMAMVMVVPVLAVILYDQAVERQRSRERAIEDMLRLAHLAASQQSGVFRGVQRTLLTLTEVPAMQDGDGSACAALLANVLRVHPRFLNLWMVDSHGTPLCQGAPVESVTMPRGRAWFERALRTQTTAVGDFQISATNGQPDVVLAQPIVSNSGKVERIVAAAIGLDELNVIASQANMPPGATLTLTDRHQTVLARFPQVSSSSIGRPHADGLNSELPGDVRVVDAIGADNVRRLYAVVPVDDDLDTGLMVTMAVEPGAIFMEANRRLAERLLLLALVACVAVGFAFAIGHRSIVRPAEALRVLTSRIATGDLGARAQLSTGGMEFGELGSSVGALALALETHQHTLRESEQRFRRIAETVTEVFWMADVEIAQMLYVSPAYERVWGRSCASLYQNPKSFLDAIVPADRERVLTTLKVKAAGQPFDHEYRIVRPDGEVRWIWERGFPVPNPGGAVMQYVGTAQDITARKHTEEHNQLLARAIESTNEMVSVTDLNDRLTFVNSAFLRTYGYSAEEVLGQTTALLQSIGSGPEVLQEAGQNAGGDGWLGEFVNRRKDGTELIVSLNTSVIKDPDGRVGGLLRVARDITERIGAERAVRTAEERMRFALAASEVGIWEADLKTGVSFWTERCEEMHGLAPGAYGKTFQSFIDCIHPDDQARTMAILDEATRSRREARMEYRTLWPDGSVRHIATTANFSYDETGQPVRGAGFSVDLTEQRLLEDQLRQAQKMEAVGRLAGGVAHDFNNMLTAILGNAEFALEDLPPGGLHRAELEEITKAGRRAAALTQQLLAFSRKQVLAPRVLRVGDIVGEVAPMLQRLLGGGIDLRTVISDRGFVRADAGQIEQVLINLAVNARDAMPNGGRLTLETTDTVLDDNYARFHPSVRPGPHVIIAVSDTGHGMDASTQKHVFEPFFTTKPQGQGTGLGLATVYGIVQQSGGHISFYSEAGKGTTFTVYLPQTVEADDATAAAPIESRRLNGQETILFVEDEDVVREFAQKVLSRHGYDVFAVGDPKRAIDFADLHPGTIHLVLTDVELPGMSGPSMAKVLRARHPESKVLYASGYTDNALLHQGVLDSEMWFLQKPFTANDLVARVRDVLDS